MKKISVRGWDHKGVTEYHRDDVGSCEIIVGDIIILVDNYKGRGDMMEKRTDPLIQITINGKEYDLSRIMHSNTVNQKCYFTDRFNSYVKLNGDEPKGAYCRVVFNNGDELDVLIRLNTEVGDNDDEVFFYCNGMDSLISMMDTGVEDFVVTKLYGFE